MITLNDYLYSGDTVLRILQKYIADLKVEADRNRPGSLRFSGTDRGDAGA